MAEGIKKAPAPLHYNEVRWLLGDHIEKRAGPLRIHRGRNHEYVPGSNFGRAVITDTLQELWQVGADEYAWRDVPIEEGE